MATVYREELVRTEYGTDYVIETRGYARLMPQDAQSVWAIFGMFERTDSGNLLYSMDSDGMNLSRCSDHYLDDLNALKAGRVEIADRR